MIIKSMSRKTKSFQQLLEYINKEDERKNKAILHNFITNTDDLEQITQAFLENAEYMPKRKNGITLYHEVISLPKSEKISPEILEDLAREYLQVRAPEALGYAKAHLDTDNPHIHFCISGNKIKQKIQNRLSRTAFSRVKQTLEIYKTKNYPELEKTSQRKIPSSPFIKGELRKNKERGQRTKKMLSEKISGIFLSARSLSDSLQRLKDAELEPYSRGKIDLYGVKYQGKKYRLSTLGVRELVDNRIDQIQGIKNRLSELNKIIQSKDRSRRLSQDR